MVPPRVIQQDRSYQLPLEFPCLLMHCHGRQQEYLLGCPLFLVCFCTAPVY